MEQEDATTNPRYPRLLAYDVNELSQEVIESGSKLNSEQRVLYDEVAAIVDSASGRVIFLAAPGGTDLLYQSATS